MPKSLNGINEKLKRAEQTIRNLETEIAILLSPLPRIKMMGRHPSFSDSDLKALKVLRDHAYGDPPLRFSILAGEVIHHLRSSLDHLVWELSDPSFRQKHRIGIEFPIYSIDPIKIDPRTKKNRLESYDRKVKGISSPTVLARIKSLQPYHAADPLSDPLWLIHDMDITNKHRELSVFISTVGFQFSGISGFMAEYKTQRQFIPFSSPVNMNTEVTAQIAFAQPIKGETEPVAPFLAQLLGFTRDVVQRFTGEFV